MQFLISSIRGAVFSIAVAFLALSNASHAQDNPDDFNPIGNNGSTASRASNFVTGALGGDLDDRIPEYELNIWLIRTFRFNNAWEDEDMTYKDLEIKNPENVAGAQTRTPMPHKTTPPLSPLEFNEWEMINIQNPEEDERPDNEDKLKAIRGEEQEYSPYIGSLYRGEYNLMRYRTRLNQPTKTDKDLAPCKPEMVQPMSGERDPYSPEWQRLELDNCANQFILEQTSRFTNSVHEEQSAIPTLGGATCQPFKMIPPVRRDQEYAADWYYVIAWQKLLTDSNFLARGGKAPKEPNYGSMTGPDSHNIQITDSTENPTGKFGRTELFDIAHSDLQYERILEPSHPFSPRWDFEYDEQTKFSPLTIAYGSNPINGVRCGPTNIKVDIMKWREARFDQFIMSRIVWNAACYLNYYCNLYVWQPLRCSGNTPCCSTRYDQMDRVPTAWCNAGTPDPMLTMNQLCQFATRPVVPVNALKMRSGDDPEAFPNGTPAGYRFDSYFGNHRPYMRCWDTGQECGLPKNTGFDAAMRREDGAAYAIMGAGREGQSCLMGGSLGRYNVPNPSPITDWTELKLYQVNAIRRGLFCLPQNEILYKAGGAEDFVLRRSGAAPQAKVDTPVPGTLAQGDLNRFITVPFPYPWRGYVTANLAAQRFPQFDAAQAPAMQMGLSDAKKGDILVFDQSVLMTGAPRPDAKGDPTVWRLPYVGYVTETDNALARSGPGRMTATPGSEWIKLMAINHGKYPDACGNTSDFMMGEDIQMFRDAVPAWVTDRLAKVGESTDLCTDPAMAYCVEPQWDAVKRYNIHEDVRP